MTLAWSFFHEQDARCEGMAGREREAPHARAVSCYSFHGNRHKCFVCSEQFVQPAPHDARRTNPRLFLRPVLKDFLLVLLRFVHQVP